MADSLPDHSGSVTFYTAGDGIWRVLGYDSVKDWLDEQGTAAVELVLVAERDRLLAENEALKAERDENEHALRKFQAGLTDALRVHNVPAMPSWSEAIHWLPRDGYKRGVDAGVRWTIARIRGEADETFDLALDSELRALADLIADEHANGKCSVESDEQERTDG